ncbi:MAG: VTT domain-containing protein [Gemmatimonadota bacterium]
MRKAVVNQLGSPHQTEAEHHERSTALRGTAVVLVLSGVVALVVSSDRLHGLLLKLFEQAGAVIAERPLVGAMVFVLLSAIGAMVMFVSGSVLVPPALLAWGGVRTMLLLWLGWVIGAATAYVLARRLGRPAVAWLTSRPSLERYEKWVPAQAPIGLVVLFQLAIPSEIAGYVFGLARCPFGKYLAAAAIGELPYAFAVVYFGSTMLHRRLVSLLVVGAAGALLGLVALTLLRSRLSAYRASSQR